MEILGKTDFNLFEDFVNEWMLVLEKLIPSLEIDYLNRILLSQLKALTSLNSTLKDRLSGYRIFSIVFTSHIC